MNEDSEEFLSQLGSAQNNLGLTREDSDKHMSSFISSIGESNDKIKEMVHILI